MQILQHLLPKEYRLCYWLQLPQSVSVVHALSLSHYCKWSSSFTCKEAGSSIDVALGSFCYLQNVSFTTSWCRGCFGELAQTGQWFEMCDTVRTLEEALVEHRGETEMTLVIFFILLSPSLGQFLVKYQVGSGNSGQSYIEKKCTTVCGLLQLQALYIWTVKIRCWVSIWSPNRI